MLNYSEQKQSADVKVVELYPQQTPWPNAGMSRKPAGPSDKRRPRVDEIGKRVKLSPIVADPSSN